MIAPMTVADCPNTILFRPRARQVETPPESGNFVTVYDEVKATYCWLFSVDEHGAVGRRYINANHSPFVYLEDDGSPIAGWMCKLDPWNGEVKYADSTSPCPITEARLEAWQDAGILVDPHPGDRP